VLQCVASIFADALVGNRAVCCSTLQCVAMCCDVLHVSISHFAGALVGNHHSNPCVLQCFVVCCSVLQCVAVRYTY